MRSDGVRALKSRHPQRAVWELKTVLADAVTGELLGSSWRAEELEWRQIHTDRVRGVVKLGAAIEELSAEDNLDALEEIAVTEDKATKDDRLANCPPVQCTCESRRVILYSALHWFAYWKHRAAAERPPSEPLGSGMVWDQRNDQWRERPETVCDLYLSELAERETFRKSKGRVRVAAVRQEFADTRDDASSNSVKKYHKRLEEADKQREKDWDWANERVAELKGGARKGST